MAAEHLDSAIGSLEPPDYDEEMEVDHASTAMAVGINYSSRRVTDTGQCTDHATPPPGVLTLPSRHSYCLSMYDKTILSDFVERRMSVLKRYEVNQPIGCAMLLSSDGTLSTPSDLSSVGSDMEAMDRTLKDGGWDIICKAKRLESTTLLAYLSALGKETQLRPPLGQQRRELSDYSVFLLYYTGHGTAEGVFLNDDKLLHYRDIVATVSEVPCLFEKPKIFIFDSCRMKKAVTNAAQDVSVATESCSSMAANDVATQEDRNSHKPYPPPHTVVCFAAAEDQYSFMDRKEGSFYTLALSHALRQFGSDLSFQEIITQVNGGTHEVACCRQKIQTPIFMSTLEKQLVFDTFDCAERDGPVTIPLMESGIPTLDSLVISKCTERDTIPKDPKERREWKSREQVMSDIPHLGDGVSVFFIYAPNPMDAYEPAATEDRWELRNRFLMSRLFFDLELHGFHVLSDLHLGSTEPVNWVQWYVSRIAHCNFVVFVCSPAFKELFEASPEVEKLANPKAKRLVGYRNAVYAGITEELSRGGRRRKFLPVILDDFPKESSSCVPLLFQPGTVYHVPKEEQRRFNFDDKSRDFEKLVCHMAGINRNELERQGHVSQVAVLPRPYEKVDLWASDMEEACRGPPKGYVMSTDASPRPLVGAALPMPGVAGGRHNEIQKAPSIASSMQPYPYPPQSHPQAHQPHPQPHSRYQQPHPQPHPVYQQTHPHPDYQHQPRPQPHPGYYQPYPHGYQQPQTPPTRDDLNSLPLKAPDTKIYLWLSTKIASWQFIGRHLGLDEADLERIRADHGGGGTDEQCYQMLLRWRMTSGRDECTYRRLGQVLRDSNKNKHLYAEYVERVRAVEKLQ